VTALRWQLPWRNRAGSAQVVRLTADLWKRINGVPPGEARPRSSPRGGRMGAGRHSHRDGDTAAGRPAPRPGRALRRMERGLLLAPLRRATICGGVAALRHALGGEGAADVSAPTVVAAAGCHR
jgi:hypothetical protein